ncbi:MULTISPECIES: hypothetical protein [Pedobacter]|uniref:Uncharacterized protein n=1 Tax=Pedobacter suwonensis TaxID=332999 RepID=A0A1I0TU00_9SPHI|nr:MULTISPECIES: hypothetical protein [Pedobacter]SFA55157.1 hypothetical protein SAMN04488511_11498 [Pedobacter suwonensis]
MHHLNNALSKLNSVFHSTWTTALSSVLSSDNINDVNNKLAAQVAILGIINRISNEFYKELNLSIVSGEYVNDLTISDTKISEIESFISLQAVFDVPRFPNMLQYYQDIFAEGFLQPIRLNLLQYRALLKVVGRHIAHQPGSSMLFHEIADPPPTSRRFTTTATKLSELFNFNVKVAEIDHTLSFEKNTFKQLLLLQHKLKNFAIASDELELISDKCDFLLYKLSFRLEQSNKKFHYVIDFNYSTLTLKEVNRFSKYTDIIKGHYGKNATVIAFNQRSANAQGKLDTTPTTLNLDEYHSLIKKIKDVDKNVESLNKLNTNYSLAYNQRILGALSDFDRRAYDIDMCYIENNLFSLELERKLITLDNWESKLQTYTTRAESLNNSNFFPFYKIIAEFLVPEIEKQFKINNEESLKVINKLLDKYDKYLTSLIINATICEETDYIAFQTDYATSLTPIRLSSGFTYNCFVSSSFVLPIEYTKFKDEIDIYKTKLTKFRAMYDIQDLLQTDHKTIQEVKEEIEKTDKRHIEILSIFSALVLFVSNEVQIFSKLTKLSDAIIYSLSFAYGLGLFVLLIWFITRSEGVRKTRITNTHKLIFGVFALGFILQVTFLRYPHLFKSERDNKIDNLSFKIDSAKKELSLDTAIQKLVKKDTLRTKVAQKK